MKAGNEAAPMVAWARKYGIKSTIHTGGPSVPGSGYIDKDVVLEADAATLKGAHARALGRDLPMSVYTREMFSTGHDEANRAAVRAVRRDDLDLVGIAVFGPKNGVDKTVKGARLHP